MKFPENIFLRVEVFVTFDRFDLGQSNLDVIFKAHSHCHKADENKTVD